MNSKLENIIRVAKEWAIPIVGAAVAVTLLEYTGIPSFLQDYEIARSNVSRDFFGSFAGNWHYYGSYVARGAMDLAIGAIGAGYIYDKIKK